MQGRLDALYEQSEALVRERISPYKLTLYLLLSELEGLQQSADEGGLSEELHAFYGLLFAALARRGHMSIGALKCCLLRYSPPARLGGAKDLHMTLFKNFIRCLASHTEGISIMPCNSALFNPQRNANFARRRSIIGIFARKMELQYFHLDFSQQTALHAEWLEYLKEAPSIEELSEMLREWKWQDTAGLLHRVCDLEIQLKGTVKREVKSEEMEDD